MPVIKSAKKKLRQTKKRTLENRGLKQRLNFLMKTFKKSPSEKSLRETISFIDKAKKKNLIHKNKAARWKSKLTKLINSAHGKKSAKN